jgi:LuxR family quorum sensing-dependent transcriptional regulator
VVTSHARRNFAFGAIEEIASARSLPEVRERFAGAIAKKGFIGFGIAEMPAQEPGANPIILMESSPADFRQVYKRERLYRINHLAAHVRVAVHPFRFSEAPFFPRQSRGNDRYMQVLRSFGLGRGLLIPLGRPRNIPSCVWLCGEDPDLDDDTIRVLQPIAVFTANKVQVLSASSDGIRPQLTARESEVLTWAAHGKSAWETGEILHIAKRTVDEHIQTAARKLGAANKTQAVAQALVRRFIRL